MLKNKREGLKRSKTQEMTFCRGDAVGGMIQAEAI